MFTYILISFILGFFFAFLLRLIAINRREKKGLYEIKYKPIGLSSKMKVLLREVIFKFSIKKSNRDFLLNINSDGRCIIQIMHRSHFPEFCKDIADIKFGLALYIPTKPLTSDQKIKLTQVLKEESEDFNTTDYPVEYFVIDAGSRVRYTGYLIARVIKEVFNRDDVSYELFDEGNLPYHYRLEIPKGNPGLN